MRGPVQRQAFCYTKHRTPIYQGFRNTHRNLDGQVEPTVASIVVAQEKDVFPARGTCTQVDLVQLHQSIRR